MNLTRREFIKITGAGVFCLLSGCISQLRISTYDNMQTFSITVLHKLSDSNDGKEFAIPDFPKNCIIKETRIRSNFTSGQQNWRVAFIDNKEGITPTDTEILCRTAEIFERGDYIFIGDEMALVESSNKIKNIITAKRGVKGTVPMYHDKDTRMETVNNGIRLILYNSKNFMDSLILENIKTWKSISFSFIREGDNHIRVIDPPINLDKYDIIYIKDILNTERSTIIGTIKSEKYGNIIYTKNLLLSHFPITEIQKQTIYNIPIIYTGEENNLSGIIYIDEKIENDVTIGIDIIVVGQTDAIR